MPRFNFQIPQRIESSGQVHLHRSLVNLQASQLLWRDPALVRALHLGLERLQRLQIFVSSLTHVCLPTHHQAIRHPHVGKIGAQKVGSLARVSAVSEDNAPSGAFYPLPLTLMTQSAVAT